MPKFSSDLFGNLRRVYKNYGNFSDVLKSEYFCLSLFVTGLCWRNAADDTWASTAWSVLPNLTGFSIAAYALLFSVLDNEQRQALRQPSAELNGRAPFLILASSITHAIIIQISAIIYAVCYNAKPLPYNYNIPELNYISNVAFSICGIVLFSYAVILVLASVLSIFRLLIIVPPVKPKVTAAPKVKPSRVSKPAKREGRIAHGRTETRQ